MFHRKHILVHDVMTRIGRLKNLRKSVLLHIRNVNGLCIIFLNRYSPTFTQIACGEMIYQRVAGSIHQCL